MISASGRSFFCCSRPPSLISSGAYAAGAIWPSVFERAIAYGGWRQTMLYFGLLEAAVVVPLAAIFLRQPPELSLSGDLRVPQSARARVLGWPPNLMFALVAMAVVFCCI